MFIQCTQHRFIIDVNHTKSYIIDRTILSEGKCFAMWSKTSTFSNCVPLLEWIESYDVRMSDTLEFYIQLRSEGSQWRSTNCLWSKKKNVSPTGLGKSSRPWESEKECPLKINEKPLVGIKRFGRVRLLLGFALRLPPHRHDPGKPTHQGRCFFLTNSLESHS